MPKPKLPPQGGEKWLCLGMFLTIMFSVVMVVTLIYCTVIIYKPSLEEMSLNIIGPKRCTTTLVKRNLTGTPEDGICSWSSCEEWCLSKGASPCSKVFGVLRDRGADMVWEGCELEEDFFVDHTCNTLADLKPMNCKRSKFELERPGEKEVCTHFNDIISCEMGECKNVSNIYACTFTDTLQELHEVWGKEGYEMDGYCNCNQCTESNVSLVVDVTISALQCPKDTRYCFEKGRNPETYSEEKKELCKEPKCQTCFDMCNAQLHCLSMHSRQDVAYFGVDMTRNPPEPKLTYYNCLKCDCTKIHQLKCQRVCDFKEFDFKDKNMVLFSGERVVMGHCRKAFINGSVDTPMPESAVQNPAWTRLAATCSTITINKEMKSIYGSDCTNGTWLDDLGTTNYSNLMTIYSVAREQRERFIKYEVNASKSLIPLESDITIVNNTRILKNTEGCVNTLSMECMKFYADYGLDGANYTSRVSFDCYHDPALPDFVVIDFSPDRTMMWLLLWSLVPLCVMVCSCCYICICSRFMYTGEDGHMRIFCCGRAITGIGHVVVYKPPPKPPKREKRNFDDEKNEPVAI